MAYENILFHKSHMATRDGYFYLVDYPNGTLSQKTANGETTFQYPLDIPNSFTTYDVGDVVCLQYDGYSLWSMQDFTAGNGFLIRQWAIDNHLCVLTSQYPKIDEAGVVTYRADTFSVEYYNTLLSADISDGDLVISIDEYAESVIFPGTVIGIGYNKYDEREQVTVSGVSGQDIYLSAPVVRSYFAGDNVVITPSIMFFNNYYGTSNTTGSLTMFDPNTGDDISNVSDVEYLGITASKFVRLQNVLQEYPDIHTLAYVKGTNLKLRDMSDLYRYSADIRGSDDFEGEDYSAPDETKWSVPYGDPVLLNNKLFCSTVGVGHDRVDSTYKLVGDFSLQVSGTVGDMTVFSGTGVSKYFDHYLAFNFIGDTGEYSVGFNYDTLRALPFDDSDLLVRLDFEGDSLDTSGNNHHAVPYNSPTLVAGVNGEEGSAYSFNGTSYLRISNATELEVGKNNADFTVMFWVYLNTNTTADWQSITHKGTSSDTRTFSIWRYSGGNTLHCRITTTANYNEGADTVTPLSYYTWTHITYVKKGNTFAMYLDGVQDSLTNLVGDTVSNTGDIYIGDSPWYNGVPGYIDNYKLYARAVEVDEILYIIENEQNVDSADALDGLSLVSTSYDSTLLDYDVVASGIAKIDYNFKAERVTDKLYLSYQTMTSGIADMPWHTFPALDVPTYECLFSMGLRSALITVSGSYFDSLEFTTGYLRYPGSDTPYYGIMQMDNVQTNQSTIHTIYDIDIQGDDLYRLQKTATYYGSNYSWSTYNFQVSPIRSFVDFITIDSDTHILPATGRNVTPVRSVTLDQYGQGVVNRPVTFIDDDDVGFITTEVVYTDIFYNTGRADTAYTSGTDLRVATINAKVTQLD